MQNEKTEVIRKEQCQHCAADGLDTSHDNLVTFASGVQHCHRHGTITKKESAQIPSLLTNRSSMKSDNTFPMSGEFPTSSIRGINPETFKFYDYQINREKGVHIANYKDVSGNIVMQQLRTADKQFPVLGNRQHSGDLYGAWKFTPDERVFITITEGQLDCLSIAQAFDCKYPVVSLPHGAGNATSVINEHRKYLEGFKYVVLAFDSDKPGREATEACLKLFEPGKVRVASLPSKDANEMLKEGKTSDLRKAVYAAVEYIPPSILTGDDWVKGLEGYQRQSYPWPWAACNAAISPVSVPAIYSIAALPGVGKTVVVADIMKQAIERKGKVGVISLEESLQGLLLKLTDAVNNTRLSEVSNREYTEEEIQMCREVAKNVVTFDHRTYGSNLDTILDNLPYIAQALDCETIIFDNLSYSATDVDDDERRSIDKAMIRLKDSTTKYNFVLFNVCHLNDEGSIRGSRGVQMYSDYVIHLDRDTESEDYNERNKLTFTVKKDRFRGVDTGKSFDLYYDPKTRRFKDF